MRKLILLVAIGTAVLPSISLARSQVMVGFSGEYRLINIYGQSSGVPSYEGKVYTPELQYAITTKRNSFRLYGNFGFGTLPNTANSASVSETYLHRVFGAGFALHFDNLWFRAGLNYHASRDEVGGTTARVVEFKGPGVELGTGIAFHLTGLTEVSIGARLQLAQFSSDSSRYFRGRRDFVSYAGFIGLNFIIPSSGADEL